MRHLLWVAVIALGIGSPAAAGEGRISTGTIACVKSETLHALKIAIDANQLFGLQAFLEFQREGKCRMLDKGTRVYVVGWGTSMFEIRLRSSLLDTYWVFSEHVER